MTGRTRLLTRPELTFSFFSHTSFSSSFNCVEPLSLPVCPLLSSPPFRIRSSCGSVQEGTPGRSETGPFLGFPPKLFKLSLVFWRLGPSACLTRDPAGERQLTSGRGGLVEGGLEGLERREMGHRMEGVAVLFYAPLSFQQVFVHYCTVWWCNGWHCRLTARRFRVRVPV